MKTKGCICIDIDTQTADNTLDTEGQSLGRVSHF